MKIFRFVGLLIGYCLIDSFSCVVLKKENLRDFRDRAGLHSNEASLRASVIQEPVISLEPRATKRNIDQLQSELKDIQLKKKFGSFFDSQDRIYAKDPRPYYDSSYSSTVQREKHLKGLISNLEFKLENGIPEDVISVSNYNRYGNSRQEDDMVHSYSEISKDNKVNYWEEQKKPKKSNKKEYFTNTGEKVEAVEVNS